MVLVDEVGGYYPYISHSAWNNIQFADFVMPWFLFMMGTSIPFSLARFTRANKRRRLAGTKKVVARGIKLYLLGLLMQVRG